MGVFPHITTLPALGLIARKTERQNDDKNYRNMCQRHISKTSQKLVAIAKAAARAASSDNVGVGDANNNPKRKLANHVDLSPSHASARRLQSGR